MNLKKVRRIVPILMAAMLAVGLYYYVDCAYHPDLRISQRSGKENDHFEIITMVLVPKSQTIPLAESVEAHLREFQDWNNGVVDEASAYALPIDVRSFGEVKNGRTTVRYEGCVTTAEGESVEYLRHTFDFVIAPDSAWPKES